MDSLLTKIKVLCARNETSISALEKALTFSNGSICKWDSKEPSSGRLAKVADYFNVSTDYLLGRTENPSPYNEVIAASSSDSDFYENLTDEGRDELEKYKELLKLKYGEK